MRMGENGSKLNAKKTSGIKILSRKHVKTQTVDLFVGTLNSKQ